MATTSEKLEPGARRGESHGLVKCGEPKASKDNSSLLEVFTKAIDDMRSLVTCRICTRPMYEPYTTGCGHSYCYSCLVQWFSSHRRNKSCPGCRAKIIQQPVPDYTIRNLVQVLISHPAFLEDGDTIERLREDQKKEANLVERDKSNRAQKGGILFNGCFRCAPRISIFDTSDGIHRCPSCNWELEDRYCLRCERTFELDGDSDAALSFSEGEDTDLDGELDRMRGIYDAFDREATVGFGTGRPPRYSSPGLTPPYYDSDGQDSISSYDSEMHMIRQIALNARNRDPAREESSTTWSSSASDIEQYDTPPPRSIPHGPITWENHPNFAQRPPDDFSIDEHDPELDDFIDDGSDVRSLSTERLQVEDSTDVEELSLYSGDDSPVVTRRRRGLLHDHEDVEEDEGEGFEPSRQSSSNGQDDDTGRGRPDEEDEQSVGSAESIKLTSQQQRKRRRMVVVDDSDEEEEFSNGREKRSRTRRGLNSRPAVLRRGHGVTTIPNATDGGVPRSAGYGQTELPLPDDDSEIYVPPRLMSASHLAVLIPNLSARRSQTGASYLAVSRRNNDWSSLGSRSLVP